MTYKFTPGEYLTRDGRKAVVLCDDAPGEYPLVGYIVIPEIGSTAESWLPNGCCYSGDPDDDDLVASEWDQAIEAARNALIEWAAKPIDPRSAAGVVSALKRGKP